MSRTTPMKSAERAVDAEGLTFGSQDDEPAELTVTANGVVGVIPLISIDEAVHAHISSSRHHYLRSGCVSVRSFASNLSSMSGTMRSCGLGSMRHMLGSILEAPPRLLISRERLRLRRSEVFGKGAYGLVVRGDLYGGGCAVSPETPEIHTSASGENQCGSSNTQESEAPSELVSLVEPRSDSEGERTPPMFHQTMPSGLRANPLAESTRPVDTCAAQGTEKTTPDAHTTLVNDDALFCLHDETLPSQCSLDVSRDSSPAVSEGQTVCSFSEAPRPVAVKLIDKSRLSRRRQCVSSFQVELRFAGALRHPSIIAVHGVAEEETELMLVMDIADGGSLKDFTRRHTKEEVWEKAPHILADIVLALEYLGALGVAHRDIKPDNILLTADHHARLADFGNACYLDDAETNKFGGTAPYMSPEVVETGCATATSDFWALGCVIFELFAGHSPFHDETSMLVLRKIKQFRSGTLVCPPDFPACVRDLVGRLICREPDDRLASAQTGGISALKTHAFFADIDWSGGSAKAIPRGVDYSAHIRHALDANERVLRCAMIVKVNGFMRPFRERLLVLTDRPRLFYLHPSTREVRNSIALTRDVYADVQSPSQFRVVTPKSAGGRTFIFRDTAQRAALWAALVNRNARRPSEPFAGASLSRPPRPRRHSSSGTTTTTTTTAAGKDSGIAGGKGNGIAAVLAQSAPSLWSLRRWFGKREKGGEAK